LDRLYHSDQYKWNEKCATTKTNIIDYMISTDNQGNVIKTQKGSRLRFKGLYVMYFLRDGANTARHCKILFILKVPGLFFNVKTES